MRRSMLLPRRIGANTPMGIEIVIPVNSLESVNSNDLCQGGLSQTNN
jgi:hypothetical protein